MSILRTEGFEQLIRGVARDAAGRATAEDAVNYAASMGGRLPLELGLRPFTRVEERLYTAICSAHARLDQDPEGTERIVLTRTGRTRLLRAAEPLPEHAIALGAVVWQHGRPPDLDRELDRCAGQDRDEARGMADWLCSLPRAQVTDMVRRVRFTILHIPPVLFYTGNGCYTNLGKWANLSGKSVRPGTGRCLLTRLENQPADAWDPEEACFLVCAHALLSSGPPVRMEDFNGLQLRPDRLAAFVRERLQDYGGDAPGTPGAPPTGAELHTLASACAAARGRAVAAGGVFYRRVHGMTLSKREHLDNRPLAIADVPPAVRDELAERLGGRTFRDFGELSAAAAAAMPELVQPLDGAFTTGFQRALHETLRAATEASASDVGMSRGPRRTLELIRALKTGSQDPFQWTTKDFYCCVTPSAAFTRRFTEAPAELPQALRSYSSRMRYNSWHYLPATLGMAESGQRDDWFFAPVMADITDWSDQHHTGHVVNGVRHAIRAPFTTTIVGADRSGVYDFRLLRTSGNPYGMDDLRSAIAVAELLRRLYQEQAAWLEERASQSGDPEGSVIVDFDNQWYSTRYTLNTTKI